MFGQSSIGGTTVSVRLESDITLAVPSSGTSLYKSIFIIRPLIVCCEIVLLNLTKKWSRFGLGMGRFDLSLKIQSTSFSLAYLEAFEFERSLSGCVNGLHHNSGCRCDVERGEVMIMKEKRKLCSVSRDNKWTNGNSAGKWNWCKKMRG